MHSSRRDGPCGENTGRGYLSSSRQLWELLPDCGERLLVSVAAVDVGQSDQHLQRGGERVLHR